jgi:predicted Rossmann fold nucleotide-binding protein DprA/Smf involved in DNA uptake
MDLKSELYQRLTERNSLDRIIDTLISDIARGAATPCAQSSLKPQTQSTTEQPAAATSKRKARQSKSTGRRAMVGEETVGKVFEALTKEPQSSDDIATEADTSKVQTLRALAQLVSEGRATVSGNKRSMRWCR